MKLFGNSAGKHLRTEAIPEETPKPEVPEVSAPVPEPPVTVWGVKVPEERPKPREPRKAAPPEPEAPKPETAPPPPPRQTREDRVEFTSVQPLAPPPELLNSEIVSTNTAEYAPQAQTEEPARRKSHFLAGYLVYLFVFLLLIAAGLAALWLWMDVYERSRPYQAMEAWLANTDAAGWRQYLAAEGVEDSYLATLPLNDAEYYKKLDVYTDEAPVYGVRFGTKTMLTATLKKGAALPFGTNAWDVGAVTLSDSGLTVYAPEDAVLTVKGERVGPECLVQRDAQNVSLGPLEQDRTDIPGLAKYVLNRLYTVENLRVTDAEGSELALAASSGNAYYYPPLTSSYVIEAPASVTVTVNSVPLSEANAEITRTPLEDFEGLGDSVPVDPANLRYQVDGLVARPVVEAVRSDGSLMEPESVTEDSWIFALSPDPEFRAEQEAYILEVFDAYIAFLGNRGGDLYGNYYKYQNYLFPGSDAADRAAKSLDSLYWVAGRDAALESVTLGDVVRYGDDCFTAWLDFTRRIDENTDDDNSYLFIFARYQEQWRVVRVMNKTSFFLS